ncbi:hypothetical protein ABTW72_04885 [Micromonospora sp. NPDC127501]|uniref:hypothetical protein n=1 Tax=Micromonospora sp. NPDC127501 TaxID=3154872 RepID=UPI00333012B5
MSVDPLAFCEAVVSGGLGHRGFLKAESIQTRRPPPAARRPPPGPAARACRPGLPPGPAVRR